MKIIEHKFVEFIPEQKNIENDVIYVSLEYDIAVHNCLCGCGEQVVTPLSPTDWKVTYNGDSISLYPSIGNWDFECQSHYWIKKGNVMWAETWSEQRIQSARDADQKAKLQYFEHVTYENKETWYHRLVTYLRKLFIS